MTNRANKWIKEAFEILREEFGGSCQNCGKRKYKDNLEFAHIKPTDLNGRGRGRKERYYDVKNNPDSYTLLCRPCHKNLDSIMT